MKKLFLLPLCLIVLSCSKSSGKSPPGVSRTFSKHIGDGVVLSEDLRPVDGSFTELTIEKNAEGTYDARLHTITPGLGTDTPLDARDELASGLSCEAEKIANQYHRILCVRDDRPVDGLLTEIILAREAEGTYLATLRTASNGQVGFSSFDETKELATGFILKN